MRPIGGWLFGRIADRRGRKASMLISVCMMCMGSLVIACLPGYDTIGTLGTGAATYCKVISGALGRGEYGPARHI
ncbi:alpha-ketoglutarate transporter [Salmonella enterica subsp. enterica]|nr:alpha-ketoglutarate transporter [Salmonella enterica subsp. enterica]